MTLRGPMHSVLRWWGLLGSAAWITLPMVAHAQEAPGGAGQTLRNRVEMAMAGESVAAGGELLLSREALPAVL